MDANFNSGIEANMGDTGSTVQNEIRSNQQEIRRMQQAIDRLVQRDIGNVVAKERLRRHRNVKLDKACGGGIGLFLGGVFGLVFLGIFMVKPALKDTQLETAQCRVISSHITDERVSCDCGVSGKYDCTSSYPCLEIQVAFVVDGEKHTSYLYKDSSSVYDEKSNLQCSTQACDSEETLNDDDVNDFLLDYGLIGNEFTCYYNPKSLDKVFATRTSAKNFKLALMHTILWPSLIMLLSVGIFTLYCRAKGHCCFKKKNGSAVPYQDLN